MNDFRRVALAALTAALLASCSAGGGSTPTIPAGMQPSSAKAPMASHKARVQPMCADTHQLGVARCFALVRTDLFYKHVPRYRRVANVAQANLASAAAKAYYGPLGPAQLIQAYNLPSAKAGSGQTVGIVDAGDDPTAESDLAQYRKAFNIAACTTANGCFSKLNQNGKTSPLPAANPGWAGEISLDLDMVSAICPNCKIVLIEAKTASFKDLGTSVGTAAKAGAHQISNSYGGPECIVNKKGKIQCGSPLPAAKYYSIKNTIITASSGDSSWFAGPQAPADFQTVVSVGGTSIYPYNNSRGWLETGWTGAGSSCSVFVTRPSWVPKSTACPNQQGKKAGSMRPISDVSAVADPYTGVLVYESYPFSQAGFYVYGGTSVASPIIASVYALAGNSSSQHYGAKLYTASSSSLTDVLIGKNGIPGLANNAGQGCVPTAICAAMAGWDGPTGNGTPWGVGAF